MSEASHSPPPSHLLTGDIGPTLTRMTLPTVFGIVAILMFNLVDTFFIGMIGSEALAAVSFTFPVTFVMMNTALGIGIGASATLSRRLGAGDHQQGKILSTHAVMLAAVLAVPMSVLGWWTIEPLFRLLGAQPDSIVLIKEYLEVWYLGLPLLYIPMIGNAVIRSTGDTKTPSVIMAIAGLANGIMDPILIFGVGPLPALGIQGAAWATLISWLMATLTVVWVLGRRNRLLSRHALQTGVLASWASILRLGMPAVATNCLPQVASAIITRLVAVFGAAAVAGYGVGTRIDAIALVVVIALSSSIAPFIGQNFGARRIDRIDQALRMSLWFSTGWGLALTVLLWLGAPWVARVFSEDPAVIGAVVLFLWSLPISYGSQGAMMLIGTSLNALHRPLDATFFTVIRLFILTIPFAWLGSKLAGLTGIFVGMSFANILAGVLIWWWFRHNFRRLSA